MAAESTPVDTQLTPETQYPHEKHILGEICNIQQCPAPLQGMRRTIPPQSIPPLPSSLLPKSEGFCTLWGTFVLGAHGKEHPPGFSPHSGVAEGTQGSWTHDIPQHRASGGWRCPPKAQPCPPVWHSRKEPAQTAHPHCISLLNHRMNLGRMETSGLQERFGANKVDHLLTVSHKTPTAAGPAVPLGRKGAETLEQTLPQHNNAATSCFSLFFLIRPPDHCLKVRPEGSCGSTPIKIYPKSDFDLQCPCDICHQGQDCCQAHAAITNCHCPCTHTPPTALPGRGAPLLGDCAKDLAQCLPQQPRQGMLPTPPAHEHHLGLQ